MLKVILAYIFALVPLNWLICRYVFGRREWAWVVVPVLSLGFAIGVERAAAYDMGYDMACDENRCARDLRRLPAVHLSRFASLVHDGSDSVHHLLSQRSDGTRTPWITADRCEVKGVTTSTWQSQPVPALEGLQVQPRSLSLFRAEQMVNLPGANHPGDRFRRGGGSSMRATWS